MRHHALKDANTRQWHLLYSFLFWSTNSYYTVVGGWSFVRTILLSVRTGTEITRKRTKSMYVKFLSISTNTAKKSIQTTRNNFIIILCVMWAKIISHPVWWQKWDIISVVIINNQEKPFARRYEVGWGRDLLGVHTKIWSTRSAVRY